MACGGGSADTCSTSGDCAAGNECVDGRCRPRADASSRDASVRDASAPPDAGPQPDAGPPVGAGCSADLRSVLDAAGDVLYECPADRGCQEGRCIDACTAAAASHGNVGCDFALVSPPTYPPALPPCLAAFVTNTWARPAKITVTRGDATLDVTTFGRIPVAGMSASDWPAVPAEGIPEDGVAVLFLSSDPDAVMPETGEPLSCPVTPAVDTSTVVTGSGAGEAFRIQSDTPVSAYDILPYGGAPSHFPSAELLLPSSAWGQSYVVVDAPPGTYATPGPLWFSVLALEDGTNLQVRPVLDLPGGGEVPAAPASMITSLTLSAGQYAQWELPAGSADPSGTIVTADHDVAVFAGNRFLRLQPAPGPGGESTHQQMFPAPALGHEYVAPPYATRRADLAAESIPYRFVGAFDGTVLTYDPPVAGAPTTLSQGEVADFETDVAFRVSSQDEMHPFAVAQLMPTANLSGGSRPGAVTDADRYGPALGDEEMVVVLPPAQFLSHYVFFTDPTYATTNLALVRVADASGTFSPVTVDCLGEIGDWQAVGSEGRFEVANVDLMRAFMPGASGCDNGRHVADSGAPFGLMVWGEDTYSSYAYPAGGNAAALTTLPPLL